MKVILLVILIGCNFAFAAAPDAERDGVKFFKVKSYKVERLTQTEALSIPGLNSEISPNSINNCSGSAPEDLEPNSISLGEIVRIGKQVWKVIEDNKAVVDVETVTVNALPKGITCWDQLATWQVPKSNYYKVTYENVYGIEVINVVFRVTYAYGGSYNSVGNYLANVTVAPASINVFWGFNFTSSVMVPQILNVGTALYPTAGVELNIHWTVKSLNQSQQSISLFVDGEGHISQL